MITYGKVDKDLEDDEVTLEDSVLSLIETLAMNLPKNKVYKMFMNNVQTLIN
jgi:hypothetical protein